MQEKLQFKKIKEEEAFSEVDYWTSLYQATYCYNIILVSPSQPWPLAFYPVVTWCNYFIGWTHQICESTNHRDDGEKSL